MLSFVNMIFSSLMIMGTTSNAGKSLLVTALCRIYQRRGIRVAPFKSQNMALNSFITPEGAEIGRAQAVQAFAAKLSPHVHMNPVLLKPEGDSKSQVVVHGKPWATLSAGNYYETKKELWDRVCQSIAYMKKHYDLLIVEGAGSPAEINLKEQEIVNMKVARELRAPILLTADIDRGGVFAALKGTVDILAPEEQQLIKGCLINKFRGDVSLLWPGIEMFKEHCSVPVVGVVPYIHDIRMAQEDSVFLEELEKQKSQSINICVLKFPHLSNYDDFDALAYEQDVQVYFASRPDEVYPDRKLPDAIILPGTKTTIKDLKWLKEKGLFSVIKHLSGIGVPIVGICGGFQMLGISIHDKQLLESSQKQISGLGLLPLHTHFEPSKHTVQTEGTILSGYGFLQSCEEAPVKGYEIHMGRTNFMSAEKFHRTAENAPPSFEPMLKLSSGHSDGAISRDGKIWGTYLHGIFDEPAFRKAWLSSIGHTSDSAFSSLQQEREAAVEKLADVVEKNIDMKYIDSLIGLA